MGPSRGGAYQFPDHGRVLNPRSAYTSSGTGFTAWGGPGVSANGMPNFGNTGPLAQQTPPSFAPQPTGASGVQPAPSWLGQVGTQRRKGRLKQGFLSRIF